MNAVHGEEPAARRLGRLDEVGAVEKDHSNRPTFGDAVDLRGVVTGVADLAPRGLFRRVVHAAEDRDLDPAGEVEERGERDGGEAQYEQPSADPAHYFFVTPSTTTSTFQDSATMGEPTASLFTPWALRETLKDVFTRTMLSPR